MDFERVAPALGAFPEKKLEAGPAGMTLFGQDFRKGGRTDGGQIGGRERTE
jgi:hypothetical protein